MLCFCSFSSFVLIVFILYYPIAWSLPPCNIHWHTPVIRTFPTRSFYLRDNSHFLLFLFTYFTLLFLLHTAQPISARFRASTDNDFYSDRQPTKPRYSTSYATQTERPWNFFHTLFHRGSKIKH